MMNGAQAVIARAGRISDSSGTSAHPLAGHIGFMLRRAQLSVFQDFCEGMAQVRLRPAEYSVLVILKQYPAIRQNRLAEMLDIKPANCATLIAKLQRRGLVKREKLPVAGRAIALTLTKTGQAVLQQGTRKVGKLEQRLCDRLGTDGAAQLLGLLNRLVDNGSR